MLPNITEKNIELVFYSTLIILGIENKYSEEDKKQKIDDIIKLYDSKGYIAKEDDTPNTLTPQAIKSCLKILINSSLTMVNPVKSLSVYRIADLKQITVPSEVYANIVTSLTILEQVNFDSLFKDIKGESK